MMSHGPGPALGWGQHLQPGGRLSSLLGNTIFPKLCSQLESWAEEDEPSLGLWGHSQAGAPMSWGAAKVVLLTEQYLLEWVRSNGSHV